MWDSSEKATFVVQAFQEVHATSRSLRERSYSIVVYSVTLFLVTASFFLLEGKSLDPYKKIGALIIVVVVIACSKRLLNSTFDTLSAQAYILRSLEEQMLFHEESAYGRAGARLYPPSASSDKLTDNSHYKEQMTMYRTIIGVFGGVALMTILTSLLA